jgi:pimeloyl-ACP methyl ester carboxylesterase
MRESSESLVRIPVDSVLIEGVLALPEEPQGAVLFAHGSGSSRLSPRNQFVARVLQEAGFATLLMDLLTSEEDRVYERRFDLDLLSRRLERATGWLVGHAATAGLPTGYFGASTGAAAALRAAAAPGASVAALVSRGGRPDLAWAELGSVRAPTLLIVGGLDTVVIDLNRRAYEELKCDKKIVIVPGAGHLFEEPGALEKVAHLAVDWFRGHFPAQAKRQA